MEPLIVNEAESKKYDYNDIIVHNLDYPLDALININNVLLFGGNIEKEDWFVLCVPQINNRLDFENKLLSNSKSDSKNTSKDSFKAKSKINNKNSIKYTMPIDS